MRLPKRSLERKLLLKIYEKLQERADKNGRVSNADINIILGAMFHIDKEDRLMVLEKLKKMGLISRIRKRVVIAGYEVELKKG